MSRLRILGWIALVVLNLLTAEAQDPLVRVRTDAGTVQGAAENGIGVYKGIPFAAPPIGNLRWKPPQPAKHWDGLRDAIQYAPDCMQKPMPPLFVAGPAGFNEDCLYLNVWTPAHRANEKLPVMVWIFGGAFVNGGSSSRFYTGEHFARSGIVFVSFNYRLGRFGFFAFPALSPEQAGEPLGNYGYMDQIAALQWVRRNIRVFGGDPDNVTIFGQSAGGASVLTLLTASAARGLFQKAIVESGGGRLPLLGIHYLDRRGDGDAPSAEETGTAFAKHAGIEGTGPDALAALRALPADRLVDGLNLSSVLVSANTWSGPVIDGAIVVQPPAAAVLDGDKRKIPVIIGANSADMGFPQWHSVADAVQAFGPDLGDALALYDPQHSRDWMRVGWRVCADLTMIEPARYVARALARAGSPIYEYRFSYVVESKQKFLPGALHGTEIPFVFNALDSTGVRGLTARDQAMADRVSRYWINFAKTGDPNGSGLPHWLQFEVSKDVVLDFANDGPVSQPDPLRSRLDLMAKVAARSASGSERTAQRSAAQSARSVAPGN
jgi:para-nitrobenzyl esterase